MASNLFLLTCGMKTEWIDVLVGSQHGIDEALGTLSTIHKHCGDIWTETVEEYRLSFTSTCWHRQWAASWESRGSPSEDTPGGRNEIATVGDPRPQEWQPLPGRRKEAFYLALKRIAQELRPLWLFSSKQWCWWLLTSQSTWSCHAF